MKPQRVQVFSLLIIAVLSLSAVFVSTTPKQPEKRSVYLPLAVQVASIQPPAVIQAQTGRSEAPDALVARQFAASAGISSSRDFELDQPEPAMPEPEYLPELRKFTAEVSDGDPETVRGVYVPGVLALPVLQQPSGQAAYVSEQDGVVTQFQSAARYGITGLLAHNYLSGEQFFDLEVDHEVYIVMGDGSTRRYQITEIISYQKLTPNSLRSNMRNLETDEILTTSEVFSQVYRGEHKVTFQTCLEGEGLLNWGLIFIIAEPLDLEAAH